MLARIDAGKAADDEEIDVLRLEYETIKDRCPHNHAPSDHELFRAQQRMAPEFGAINGRPAVSDWEALAIKARWHWSTIWLFLFIWMAVAGAGVYAWCIPMS